MPCPTRILANRPSSPPGPLGAGLPAHASEAGPRHTIYYADLALQSGAATPREMGNILDVVAAFCEDEGLPPLSAFAVLWETGEVSDGHAQVSNVPPGVARRYGHEMLRSKPIQDLFRIMERYDAWTPRYFRPRSATDAD